MLERLPSAELGRAGAAPSVAASSVLRRASCDAVVFHAVGPLPERYEELVAQYRLPVVWVNSKRAADCCHYDDLGTARAVTSHLIGLGHRRIAVLSGVAGPESHYSIDDRRDGYAEAMRDAGLAPRVVEFGDDVVFGHLPPPSTLLGPLLAGADRPTALLAHDTILAGMAYVEAIRRGLSVPRDLSLVTFGPHVNNATGVRFGLCQLPEAELGARAADLALRKIDAPDEPLPAEVLAVEFLPHDTVAPSA